ncbi:MAG: ECF-type sigma factor, partial [Phycisphaerales bacterium]
VEAFEPTDSSADVAGILDLEDALQSLAAIDPRSAKVAVLRIFGGMSMEHVARLNETSLPTAERDWRFARAFLEKQYGVTSAEDESAAKDAA